MVSAAAFSLGAADPTPTGTPFDLSSVKQLTLHEAQKNATKNQYQIGDRIPLLIEIESTAADTGEALSLKTPEGSSKLEDQGWYVDPSTQFLSGVFRFIVSPIQTGNLTLPTLLVTKSDGTTIGRTTPFTIQVSGPNEKEAKPPELIEPGSVSLPTKYWILFSAIGLLLLSGAIYLLLRVLKKRKIQKPKEIPVQPIEPDHVISLRKVAELYQQYPYSIENLKPVCFGLSEILKDYFSTRFKIDASESTTDEMLALLKKESVGQESLQEIQKLFQELDLVKFTKSENYLTFDEAQYQDVKIRAQTIIQKWALQSTPLTPPLNGGVS